MSTEDVAVREVEHKTIAYLRCEGPWRQLPDMLIKLNEHMTRRGLISVGLVSAFYYNTLKDVEVDDLVWEVFCPVEFEAPESFDDTEGFGIRKISTRRVATIIHKEAFWRAGARTSFM